MYFLWLFLLLIRILSEFCEFGRTRGAHNSRAEEDYQQVDDLMSRASKEGVGDFSEALRKVGSRDESGNWETGGGGTRKEGETV